jgi:hypothetical protein
MFARVLFGAACGILCAAMVSCRQATPWDQFIPTVDLCDLTFVTFLGACACKYVMRPDATNDDLSKP